MFSPFEACTHGDTQKTTQRYMLVSGRNARRRSYTRRSSLTRNPVLSRPERRAPRTHSLSLITVRVHRTGQSSDARVTRAADNGACMLNAMHQSMTWRAVQSRVTRVRTRASARRPARDARLMIVSDTAHTSRNPQLATAFKCFFSLRRNARVDTYGYSAVVGGRGERLVRCSIYICTKRTA